MNSSSQGLISLASTMLSSKFLRTSSTPVPPQEKKNNTAASVVATPPVQELVPVTPPPTYSSHLSSPASELPSFLPSTSQTLRTLLTPAPPPCANCARRDLEIQLLQLQLSQQQAAPQARSVVHRIFAVVVFLLFLMARALWPWIRAAGREGLRWERRQRIGERVFAVMGNGMVWVRQVVEDVAELNKAEGRRVEECWSVGVSIAKMLGVVVAEAVDGVGEGVRAGLKVE